MMRTWYVGLCVHAPSSTDHRRAYVVVVVAWLVMQILASARAADIVIEVIVLNEHGTKVTHRLGPYNSVDGDSLDGPMVLSELGEYFVLLENYHWFLVSSVSHIESRRMLDEWKYAVWNHLGSVDTPLADIVAELSDISTKSFKGTPELNAKAFTLKTVQSLGLILHGGSVDGPLDFTKKAFEKYRDCHKPLLHTLKVEVSRRSHGVRKSSNYDVRPLSHSTLVDHVHCHTWTRTFIRSLSMPTLPAG